MPLFIEKTNKYLKDQVIRECQENPNEKCRNRIMLAGMARLDQDFREFEKALHRESIKVSVGVDWVLLAISAATATVGGGSTKSILGAVSTSIQGAKSAFDKRVFRDKSVEVILAHMKALRAERALTIRKGLGMKIDAYPLEAAFADLGRYFDAGTLSEAMSSLVETATVKKTEARAKLHIFLDDAYGHDEASATLKNYLYPDGNALRNEDNAKKAKECMKKVGLKTDAGWLGGLITGKDPLTAQARIAVARCLGLMQGPQPGEQP